MQDKETLFSQKAETYLCCFNNHCPLHQRCLRWEVGRHTRAGAHIVTCINPLGDHTSDGLCAHFRDNRRLTMPVGMKKHFYHDMPGRMERSIKSRLIAASSRSTYYKYHSGKQPIGPDCHALIERVCRQEGWNGPLRFDSEVTTYDW